MFIAKQVPLDRVDTFYAQERMEELCNRHDIIIFGQYPINTAHVRPLEGVFHIRTIQGGHIMFPHGTEASTVREVQALYGKEYEQWDVVAEVDAHRSGYAQTYVTYKHLGSVARQIAEQIGADVEIDVIRFVGYTQIPKWEV